jgi:SOS response regulatory protein OraA/RecX
LEREYEKLKGKFEDRKIMEKLLRKGFRYDDIMKLKKLKLNDR